MGQLKVVNGGIQLDGQALILNELRTSNIRSRHGQPIVFGTKNRKQDKLPPGKLTFFYLHFFEFQNHLEI